MKILFYWYYVLVQVVGGGSVYATGEYRLPKSENDFTQDAAEVRWVIAGQEGRSSFYAWAVPDEGYTFEGFYDSEGDTLLSADGERARLWVTSEIGENENGIVSGNSFYPAQPLRVIEARFTNGVSTGVEENAEERSAVKMLIDGRVCVRRGGEVYNLNGQRL